MRLFRLGCPFSLPFSLFKLALAAGVIILALFLFLFLLCARVEIFLDQLSATFVSIIIQVVRVSCLVWRGQELFWVEIKTLTVGKIL